MVGDDLHLGQTVEHAREKTMRAICHTRLVGASPKNLPDPRISTFASPGIVGHPRIARAGCIQIGNLMVTRRHALKIGTKLGIVEWLAVLR